MNTIDLKHKVFKIIADVSDQMEIPAYVVGGYVRDQLLNRECKDIDIVCVGDGIALANKTAKAISKNLKVTIFKNFGTAMFHYQDFDVEFVGARKESYAPESRKPSVQTGTLDDDQKRRDFTINALAVSLNGDEIGQLIDPFDGLQDLENKIIRTPLEPGITFSDDPLRMMRAIRFASQLQFKIDSAAIEAIKQNRERIKIVSQERIITELNKIILSKQPSIGFKLLYDTGLLDIIFPELTNLYGVEFKKGIGHKDNFYHTLQVLDNLCHNTTDLWMRWAAILHDIAKPETKRFDDVNGWSFHGHEYLGSKMVPKIFKRMKLPMNENMKFVQKLVLLHLRPISLTTENITDAAIRRLLYDAGDDIDKLMLLCDADITSKNEKKVARFLDNFEMVRYKLQEVEEKDQIRNFQPPISGELIMTTFNIAPSRNVGKIKNAIKEAIIEGDIQNDYQQAYDLMLKLGSDLGLTKVG